MTDVLRESLWTMALVTPASNRNSPKDDEAVYQACAASAGLTEDLLPAKRPEGQLAIPA